MTFELDRRTVLKALAAGSASLAFAGLASANGRARYLVHGRGVGLRRRLERNGYEVAHALADGSVFVVHGPDGATDDLRGLRGVRHAAMDALFRLERPEEVEGLEESEDDALFGLQWDKHNTAATEAHETATGAGRSVAIIDTGVEVGHPDLEHRTGAGDAMNGLPTEVEFHDELDGDGNLVTTVRHGVDEVVRPGLFWWDHDVINQDTCEFLGYEGSILQAPADHPVAIDVVDHGTHVAGIAAGSNDGTTGIVGTAPDATIVPLRVFNWITEEVEVNDAGDTEEVANILASFASIFLAIDYASRLGVDAMNLSIGTPPLPPRVNAGGIRGVGERVVQTASARGSLVVVSAGNADANLQQGGFFTLPNSLAGAMSISATGPNDRRVFYSNFGVNEVSVGAPGGGYETLQKTLCLDLDGDGDGEFVAVTEPDGDDPDCAPDETAVIDCTIPAFPYPTNLVLSSVPAAFWGGDYAWFAGTSMAAPQVTGTAALVREVAPGANARQVEKAIEQGAEAVEGESRAELGHGRLNCLRAIEAPVIR